jgi:hypothetical protein|uniref:ELIP like protein n=2 Tax=Heterosigma akashiwo TaxID=2829 RepID=B2XT63_HETAK|nr:ELIP like protein [Heterosigma akashiwo]ABV65961.1 ELIP like protein [Heterosigma akashiwo]ABV70102.1 ELIP like protein [Heterosigma akashiwo]
MKKNWNWGLTKNAETLNGRIAMIGIFLLIFLEFIFNKSFLSFIKII